MPVRDPFVVVGESLVDIVVDHEGHTTEAVGGSPMNVAVGLSRLDVPTLLLTQIGDDAHGGQVGEHLHSSGVRLSPSAVQPGRRTSTATARLGTENSVSYEFDLVWDLAVQELPELVGLHVGSLGASLPPGRESVLRLARQVAAKDCFLSYDPNIRPAFLHDRQDAWADTVEIAALSNLVKVSEEDLEALRPDKSPVAVAHDLLGGTRTQLVILTRAAAGAIALTGSLILEEPAPRVPVVDTLGAGDSFMAATLAVLLDWTVLMTGSGGLGTLDESRVRALLHSAMVAAAVTCSRRGANPPRRQELPSAWPLTSA